VPATGRVAASSRMERDFYGPMRGLAASLDDFGGEELLAATVRFERAMLQLAAVASANGGAVSAAEEQRAQSYWEEGRVALNDYAAALNALYKRGGGDSTLIAEVPAGMHRSLLFLLAVQVTAAHAAISQYLRCWFKCLRCI
jgi:hypothetical protein